MGKGALARPARTAGRPTFVVWHGRDGYRWTLYAGNGRVVADSGEAYGRETDAARAARRVIGICRGPVFVDRQAASRRVKLPLRFAAATQGPWHTTGIAGRP